MSNARKLADNLPTEGQLGGRNLIINGAMQVAQRGTSATGVGDTNGVYPTIDRYRFIIGDASAGRLTMTQEADGPVGFANSLKLACTTADTSIAAGERLFLQHKIEAQNCQAIGKGETGAKPFTVSFYVKANAAKTYGLEIFQSDHSRQCTKLFNVTTDWTRVELTFPADVDDGSSPIPNDNGEGLVLQFQLHAGSNFTSGTLNSSAFADNVNANRAAGIDSFFNSTSNTFFLTGLQLEVGSQASPFEHEPVGVTLSKSERYFQTYSKRNWQGTNEHAANYFMYCDGVFRQKMRAAPTATFVGTVEIARPQVGVSQRPNEIYGLSSEGFRGFKWPTSGTYGGQLGTHGDTYYRMSVGDAPTNRLDFDAEL